MYENHKICISAGKFLNATSEREAIVSALVYFLHPLHSHKIRRHLLIAKRNYWWRIRHVVDEYYTTGYGSGNTWCFTTFFSHLSSLQNPKTRKKALETRKAAYGATSLFLLHYSIFRFIHSGIEMIGSGRHHTCKLYFTQLNLIMILFVE